MDNQSILRPTNALNNSVSSSTHNHRVIEAETTTRNSWKFTGMSDYGKDLSNFITNKSGNDKVLYGTNYNYSNGKVIGSDRIFADVLEEQLVPGQSRMFINREFDHYKQDIVDNAKAVARYGSRLEAKGIDVHYTDIQLHAKTILKEVDGVETLFIGTGNFTAGAMMEDPLSFKAIWDGKETQIQQTVALEGRLGEVAVGLTEGIIKTAVGDTSVTDINLDLHSEAMSQVNFAVTTTNSKIIQEYREVMEALSQGRAKSTEHLIVGGPGGNSRERHIEFINKAKNKVDVISPFIDDMAIADTLVNQVSSGKDVRIITLPTSSDYKKGAGGSLKNRLEFLSRVHRGGVDIYMASESDPLMIHSKAFAIDESEAIIGSINATEKSFDRSFEISAVTDKGKEVSSQMQELIDKGRVKKVDSTYKGENSMRLLKAKIAADSFKADGLLNADYGILLADEFSSITLSASAGSSYHYGRALHQTLMNQAGYYNLGRPIPFMGTAESVMRTNAMLLGEREPTNWELGVARRFDIGFNTPGMGMWLNEKIFMPAGWGRVYKDEIGALPSLAGLFGRILDEGYLYYANVSPDYVMLGQDYETGYGPIADRREGMFETFFSKSTEFAIASAQSVGLYMAVSQPIDMLRASMSKNFIENKITSIFHSGSSFFELIEAGDAASKESIDLTQAYLSSFDWNAGPGGVVNNPRKAVEKAIGSISAEKAGLIAHAKPAGTQMIIGNLVDSEVKPGGIAAAMMLQRYQQEKVGLEFFSFNADRPEQLRYLVRSAFTNNLVLSRERGARVLEHVFVPFLEDFVNPFSPTSTVTVGREALNPHTYFNLKVQNLIDYVRQPVDIRFELRPGKTFTFRDFQFDTETAYENYQDVLKNVQKTRGELNLKVGDNTVPIDDLDDVSRRYVASRVKAMKTDVKGIDNYQKFIEATNKRLAAISKQRIELTQKLATADKENVQTIQDQIQMLGTLHSRYLMQLQSNASNIAPIIEHLGVGYKLEIASRTQDVLDMIPLNPFKWGITGRTLNSIDDTYMIGQLFSFKNSAELISDAITGDNVMARILRASQKAVPSKADWKLESGLTTEELREKIDKKTKLIEKRKARLESIQKAKADYGPPALYGRGTTFDTLDRLEAKIQGRLSKNQQDLYRYQQEEQQILAYRIDNRIATVIRADLETADRTIKSVVSYFAEQLHGGKDWQKAIEKTSNMFNRAEDLAAKDGARKEGVIFAQATDKQQVDKAGSKIHKEFKAPPSASGRVYLNPDAEDASQVMDDLIEASTEYHQSLKKLGSQGLTQAELISKAVVEQHNRNLSQQITQLQRGTGKSILGEMFIADKHWAGAAVIFSAIALNNIMSSSGGASLMDQTALLIGGSDYGISVEARGNRVLPVGELTNQWFGWDPVIVNTVVEMGTIGMALTVGSQLARAQNEMGYMVYHKNETFMRRITGNLKQGEIADNATHVMYKRVLEETSEGIIDKLVPISVDDVMAEGSNISTVYIAKNTREFHEQITRKTPDSMNGLMKYTVTSDGVFRSQNFLRTLRVKSGANTLMWGSLALLALGGAKSAIAGTLNSLSDNQTAVDFLKGGAGAIVGGFVLGAAIQMFAERSASPMKIKAAKQAAAKAPAASISVINKLSHLKGRSTGPLLGAAIGMSLAVGAWLYRSSKKEDFWDPTAGGSLDPLLGGIVGGALIGAALRSPAAGIVGAVVGASIASMANWAGLTWLKTGARNKTVDSEQTRMVSQLTKFSDTIIDGKFSNFALTTAAYAAHYGAQQDLLNEQFAGVGEEVRVVARQSPLPFLQFFTAERIKGVKGEGWNGGVVGEGGQIAYSVGIQTGPIFGTSLSLDLPVMYTPKRGFMGLSYNPENNAMNLFKFTSTVGAWAALTLGGFQVASSAIGGLFSKMPGDQFKEVGTFWLEASKALGKANRVVQTGLQKISSAALTTVIRTGTGLHKVDGMLLAHRALHESQYSDEVLEVAIHMSQGQLNALVKESGGELIDESVGTFANQVYRAAKSYEAFINSGQAAAHAMRLKPTSFAQRLFNPGVLAVAVLGAGVAWGATHLYHLFKQASSSDFQEQQDRAAEYEEMVGRHALLAGIAGLATGGIYKVFRDSIRVIDRRAIDGTGDFFMRVGSKIHDLRQHDIPRHVMFMKKMYEWNVKGSNAIYGAFDKLDTKWGRKIAFLGTVGAIWSTQFARISSEFGLVQYMDSHILYENDGESGIPTGARVANRKHQGAVAALLTIPYATAYAFVSNGFRTNQEILTKFAEENIIKEQLGNSKNFLQRITDVTLPFIKDLRVMGRHSDVHTMLKRIQSYSYDLEQLRIGDDEALSAIKSSNNIKSRKYQALKVQELVDYLGGEDKVNNFIALYERKYSGLGTLNDDEITEFDSVVKKLHDISTGKAQKKVANKAATEAGDEFIDVSDDLMRTAKMLLGQRKIARFGKKAVGAMALITLARMGIDFALNLGGTPGVRSHPTPLDKIYMSASQKGMWGSKREGHTVSFWEGTTMIGADFLRVFLGRDRIDINLVDQYNKTRKMQGEKLYTTPLVGKVGQFKQAGADLRTLQDLLVIDKSNAYLATLDFGGRTLRHGERGTYTSTYFQLQGVGHDISTATYSMATKFIFKNYVGGKGQMSKTVDSILGRAQRGEMSYEDAAVHLRNASAQSFNLKNPRTISRLSIETDGLIRGDSITASILASREREIEHIAWQPIDSLFTNTFFETMDKAKNRMSQEAHAEFLKLVTQGDRAAMYLFNSLSEEDAFGNFLAGSVIKNVVFFRGFGKAGKNANRQNIQEMASIWQQETSLSADMERYKQERSNIVKGFQDNIINPLSSTSILTFMPPQVKALASIAVLATSTAWLTVLIAKSQVRKDRIERSKELTDFWGSRKSVYAPVSHVEDSSYAAIEAFEQSERTGNMFEDTKRAREARTAAGATPDIEIMERGVRTPEGSPTILRRSINGREYRYKISDYINNVTIDGAEGLAQAQEIVKFQLEMYGRKLQYANEIFEVKVGGTPTSSSPIKRGPKTTIASNMYGDTVLKDLDKEVINRLRATGYAPLTKTAEGAKISNIYELLSYTQGVPSAELMDNLKTTLRTHARNVLTEFRENFLSTNPNSPLMQVVNIPVEGGVRQVYLWEILGNRIVDGGVAVKGGLEAGGQSILLDSAKIGDPLRLAPLEEMIKSTDEWIQEAIDSAITKATLGDGKTITDAVSGKIGADKHLREIMETILEEVQNHPNMKALLTTSSGLLDPQDLTKVQAVQSHLKNMIKKSVYQGNDAAKYADDALHYGFKAKLGAGVMGSIGLAGDIFGLITDLLYGLDTYGAYMRLAESYTSPFATQADKVMARRELGASITSTLAGMTINFLMFKGLGPAGSFLKQHWKKVAGLAVVGGLGVAFGKNVYKPLLHRAGKFAEQNQVMQSMGKTWRENSGKIEEFVGTVAGFPVELGGTIGEALGNRKMGAYAGAGAAGGLAVGLVATASLYTASNIAALIPAFAAVAAGTLSLPVMLGGLAVATIAGAGLAMVFQDDLTDFTTKALREIPKIPIVGQFIGSFIIRPYQHSRDKAARDYYAMLLNSPIQVGYIGDIVNNKWMAMVSAADDHTGSDMASNLFGDILDTATYANPAWRKNAADGLIGSPPGLTDQIIDRELRIRAQRVSDDIIGKYSWNELKEFADHSDTVEKAEKEIKAYQSKQRRIHRNQLIKNAVLASQANNVTAPAVNPTEQIKALERLAEEQKLAKESTNTDSKKIAQNTFTANIQDANSDSLNINKDVIVSVLGPTTSDPVAKKKYSAHTGTEDGKVFINIKKEKDPFSDSLAQIIYAPTNGVAKRDFNSSFQQKADAIYSNPSLMKMEAV